MFLSLSILNHLWGGWLECLWQDNLKNLGSWKKKFWEERSVSSFPHPWIKRLTGLLKLLLSDTWKYILICGWRVFSVFIIMINYCVVKQVIIVSSQLVVIERFLLTICNCNMQHVHNFIIVHLVIAVLLVGMVTRSWPAWSHRESTNIHRYRNKK